jgi:hypothetical protein
MIKPIFNGNGPSQIMRRPVSAFPSLSLTKTAPLDRPKSHLTGLRWPTPNPPLSRQVCRQRKSMKPQKQIILMGAVKLRLAPVLNGGKLLLSVDNMTTIKQTIKSPDIKRQIRGLRETARKIAASKESARNFLIATGMYSANGQIKPRYR